MIRRTSRPAAMIVIALVPFVLASCSSDGEGGAAGPTVTATQGVDPAGPPPPTATQTPSVAISTAPSVDMGRAVDILAGVQVTVSKATEVVVKAEQPGQIAGAAVAVPVTVSNESAKPFSLLGMVVTASYDGGTPGDSTTASPAKQLTGSLPVGTTAAGIYVFRVPKKYASTLNVLVSSDASPVIVQYQAK